MSVVAVAIPPKILEKTETVEVSELNHPRWENVWLNGRESSFDTGEVSPALLNLINENKIPNGRALVPGK